METNVSFAIQYVYEWEGQTYCTIQKKVTNEDWTSTYSSEDKEVAGQALIDLLAIVDGL